MQTAMQLDETEGNTMAKIITGEVRLSWPELFEPKVPPNGTEPKYSVMLLIPKSDKKTMDALFKAEKETAEERKEIFGGKVPAKLRSIIHDGDGEDDNGEPWADRYPERKGHYFMSVSANERFRPGVVDAQLNPIIDPAEVYSGVYARVSLNSFAYSASGNRGVSFGLRNVQILRDGEPLGGASKPEDDFDAVEADLI